MGMHFARKYMQKVGVDINDPEAVRAYMEKNKLEADLRHQQDVLNRGAQCDRARYQQRVFDGLSSEYASYSNRVTDQTGRMLEQEEQPKVRYTSEEKKEEHEPPTAFGAAFAALELKK